MRKIIFFIIIAFPFSLRAEERQIIDAAKNFYEHREYHQAITEALRYQGLYPQGKNLPQSFLLKGQSYFLGGNYSLAVESFKSCFKKFPNHPLGEKALYFLSSIRLRQGSPFFAMRDSLSYEKIYPQGRFIKKARLNNCYSSALSLNFDVALREIKKYKKRYPNSEDVQKIANLENLIIKEKKRPLKNPFISFLGSIFIPGFGHFYTEDYQTGWLAFFSNLLFSTLAYHGYQRGNNFQLCFFGATELVFYQYSLFSSIDKVSEYNSRKDFYKEIKMELGTPF